MRGIAISVLLLLVIIVLFASTYIVREWEQVVITQFGDPVGDPDRHPLGLGGRVGEPVDNWVPGLHEDPSGSVDRRLQRRVLPLDRGDGPILDVVVGEPGLAQHAGVLGLGDTVVLDRQLHVVANASAERADCILDDLE